MGTKTIRFCDCCGVIDDPMIQARETVYAESFDGHRNDKETVKVDLCGTCVTKLEAIVNKVRVNASELSSPAARAALYLAAWHGFFMPKKENIIPPVTPKAQQNNH